MLLLQSISVILGFVPVVLASAMYHQAVLRHFVGHVQIDLSVTPASWLWNMGKHHHAFRLRCFTVFWCFVVCVLAVSRCIPGFVALLQDEVEVSAKMVSMHAVLLSVFVNCIAVAVYACMAPRYEKGAPWILLVFILLSALDFADLDGTEIDIVQKSLSHVTVVTSMMLTLYPSDFETTPLRLAAKYLSLLLIAVDIALLSISGLAYAAFHVGLLSLGAVCINIRLNALELYAAHYLTLPEKVGDHLGHLGDFTKELSNNAFAHAVTLKHMRTLRETVVTHGQRDSRGSRQSTSSYISACSEESAVSIQAIMARHLTMNYVPSRVTQREVHPIRVLSIDGGGSKGIGVFKTLDMLETKLGKPLHELYDFFIGSSIGAAVVLAKIVKGYRFDEFSGKFVPAMASFSKGQSMLRLLCSGSAQDIEGTHQFLSAMIPDDLMHEPFDENLNKSRALHICVTTSRRCAHGGSEIHLVRNYAADDRWELGEAVRATTSFPSVCPPFFRQGREYLDGGLLANNPSLEAFNEVSHLWPLSPISVFHSLGMSGVPAVGPGQQAPDVENTTGLLNTASAIYTTIGETTAGTHYVRGLLGIFHPSAQFRRLNLPLNHHSVFLRDEADYARVVADTAAFLESSVEYQEMVADHQTRWQSERDG